MPVKAKTWSGYQFRVGLIGLVCIGFGGCSLWDGFVRYPSQNDIKTAYDTLDEETRDEKWPAIARSKGWPADPDEIPGHFRTDSDIMTQFIMAAITVPIGLLFGYFFARSYGRWVATDDEGITTSWGQNVRFDQINRLGKQKWSKGIAVVHHNEGDLERKLVLDDWKYEREPMGQIVEEVESHLAPDQIDERGPVASAADVAGHVAEESGDDSAEKDEV